uniref:Protein SCAR n=1 Tax=Oryza meridionalis TaxID=40149 RepID=A0A0E0CZA3_9ORYZ
MPLSRHEVGNEYSLGGRELYRRANQHDPEAVLDGVAMAGLVGVLRQLGDLAEFAAQVFHGLYDEVMTASARGHGLMLRVQQLEAELPLVEKDSCHTDYLYVASNRGIDWHSNPRLETGAVTKGDTPRFIMDSIKKCHGPPKLFMLDKYDIGGEGACLKRYTDPSFFKTDSACSSMLEQGIQRERRPLRAMEIRPTLQNSEIFRPPNAANNDSKLETDLSGEALDEVPTRRRQLKYRQLNGSVFRSFRPQMQNVYGETSPDEKPCSMNHSEVQISFVDSPDTNTEERDIMVDTFSSMDKGKENNYVMAGKNRLISEEALSRSSDARSAGSSKGYNSEVDIYVDALTTMDSEVETDTEHRDHGHRALVPVESSKPCSDVHGAAVSGSISFRNNGSMVPNSSDVVPAEEENNDHHQGYVCVPSPQAKPVAGEHERSSSLEELFAQEKPVSCEHERTSSLEELLLGDVHPSGHNMRSSATESNTNGVVSTVESNGTVGTTKKEKDNPIIAGISFKKTASKKSKYVGSMELIVSKVGILPRKLSKKHDLFSDSLRNMAKQLLELKIDGTKDTELYEFEANGEGCDMKCLEMSHPPIEIMESATQSVPPDSPQDNVDSRACQPEEVNQEYDHDVPPSDSPQDSVDGNVFRDIALLRSQEEQQCAGPVTVDNLLDHTPENTQDQIGEHFYREVTEDIHTEVVPENGPDIGEELEEGSINEEKVNEEDVEESNESDAYTLDENTEYIEEQVVSDDLISSPISSKKSDDPCQMAPLTLTDADDALAGKNVDNDISEMHITLSGTITESNVSAVVVESATTNDVAVQYNEQCCLHPETSFAQDLTHVSSCEVEGQNEPLPLCSSSMVGTTPDLSVDTEEIHENPILCIDSSSDLFRDALAPDSRDVPLPNISSFDWMLNGAMQKSLNVLPAKPPNGILQENNSSKDTEDAPPPLPPLPPMQWRTTKLQPGPAVLSAKFGRPPRPKPPVKYQENESYSSQDERNREPEILQEASLQNGSTSVTPEKEMVVAKVSNEIQTNIMFGRDSQESHLKGLNEYDVQASDSFSTSEFKSVGGVASVEGDNLETSQLSELIVIPEEAWSELVDIKSTSGQEKGGKHQLSTGVFNCNGMHTTGLSAEKRDDYKIYDQNEKNLLAGKGNAIADSEEKEPNGVTCQDDTKNSDLSVQQEDGQHDSSAGTARESSSSFEEEVAKFSPPRVPTPPKYPLFQVTAHDRSMAPTLVQPSVKLSDENNTILEQIKNKSFNLKPVLAKRPNMMGAPRTNLQVVAILERANAIRQAVADDDDEDSWSE